MFPFGCPMLYPIAADIVIVIHFLWIAFVILGFPVFLWLNSARWRLIHLAAVIWMVLMQVTRSICPLTYLEVWLKSEGRGAEVYSGKFIIETIERLIYVDTRHPGKNHLRHRGLSCAHRPVLLVPADCEKDEGERLRR